MNIAPFATEHFYAKYEFSTPYHLCTSDCETVTVDELLDMADMSLAQFGRLGLGYTESQGNPHLRDAIAAGYETVESDEVVVLATPVEGIYLAARALLEPDDEVIVLTPAYDALINVFEHVVGTQNVKKWAFKPTESGWRLDIEDLRNLITAQTKLLVVNFPHNPTGYLPSIDQLKELATIAEEHDLHFFCDEMYFGLVHSGTTAIPSAADVSERAIVLSGLSKTYGLPGLRTGWLVIKNKEVRENIINWKFYTSICPPAPSEFFALVALRVRDQLRDKNIAIIERNLQLVESFFERWSDLFTWRRPMAGSIALVGMNVPSVEAYSTQLAEDAGVLIQPATTLGYDDKHMRMGFGRSGFATALEKFEAYLRENQQ